MRIQTFSGSYSLAGSRSVFCSFASKLSMARSCMGRHIAVDSLRPREARPEFRSVASTGEKMAWDRLQPREARLDPWLSEADGAGELCDPM